MSRDEYVRSAWVASGRLAVAARGVIHADTKTLSAWVLDLENRLREYDDALIELMRHDRKPGDPEE